MQADSTGDPEHEAAGRLLVEALQGVWAATAAILRDDWQGFEIVVGTGVETRSRAIAWSLAAVGATCALLRHIEAQTADIDFGWTTALVAAEAGDMHLALVDLTRQARHDGEGFCVGRAVGQMAFAARLVATARGLDEQAFAQRFCRAMAQLPSDVQAW